MKTILVGVILLLAVVALVFFVHPLPNNNSTPLDTNNGINDEIIPGQYPLQGIAGYRCYNISATVEFAEGKLATSSAICNAEQHPIDSTFPNPVFEKLIPENPNKPYTLGDPFTTQGSITMKNYLILKQSCSTEFREMFAQSNNTAFISNGGEVYACYGLGGA